MASRHCGHHRWLIFPLVALFLSLMGCGGRAPDTQASYDWPGWRGPNRDGITSETLNLNGRKLLGKRWERQVGAGCSSVAIAQGRLYTAGNSGDSDTIWCLDAASGATLWTFAYDCNINPKDFEGGPAATPTIDHGRVYTLSRQGDIFCLDAATGRKIWGAHAVRNLGCKKPIWGFSGSPLVHGEQVIYPIGKTIAFAKATGKLLWQSATREAAYSSPLALSHGSTPLLAVYDNAGLAILNLTTGYELARFACGNHINIATPVAQGNDLFVSSAEQQECHLLRFDGRALAEVWKNRAIQNWPCTSILWQGRLYGFHDLDLCCVEFQTGKTVWLQKGLGECNMLNAAGQLIIQCASGEIVVADASPEGYRERLRQRVLNGRSWAPPTLCNGLLYCRSNTGQLVCLNAGA